jgi:hypothetical protein
MAATSTKGGPLLAARHEQTGAQDSALLDPLDTACPVPRRRSRASRYAVGLSCRPDMGSGAIDKRHASTTGLGSLLQA